MPQTPISMDDWLKSRPRVLSLDDYVKSRPKIYSPEELEQESGAIYKQEVEENKATLMDIIGSSLEQAGYEFLHSVTFGLADKPESSKPINQIAGVAGSIGGLAGLLIGPGKLLKGPQRLLAGGLRSGATKVLGKTAGPLVAYGASEVAGMSLLGLASDLNADPAEMAKNAKDFGIMGAVFGAAKMIHVPGHPVLGPILRQFGGRALGAVVGMYPEGYLNKDNLPNIVWQEALNTFFLAHKITPKQIISGNYASESDRNMVMEITDAVVGATAPLKTDPIEIGKEYFTKPVKQTVQMKDIVIDENQIHQETREHFKAQIRMNKKPTVDLEYNPTTKKYTATKSNSALAAYRDEIMRRLQHDEGMPGEEKKLPNSVPANVTQNEKYMKTRLSTPAETMFRVTGKDKLDQALLDQLQNADELVMTANVKSEAGKATAISDSTTMAPVKLMDNQVKFRRVVSNGKAVLVPWQVSKNLEGKIAWEGRVVPTEELSAKIDKMRGEVEALRSIAKSRGGDKKLTAQANMLQGKLNKIEKSLVTDAKSGVVSYEIAGEKPIKGTFDITKMHAKAEKDYSLIKSMPEKEIPRAHLLYMAKRYDNLSMGTADITSLYRSLKIKKDKPLLMHLSLLEERLRELEQMPAESRMHVLLKENNKKFGLQNVPLTGENEQRQLEAEVALYARRKKKMAEFTAEARKDPTGPSALSRAITQKFFGSWEDVRYAMNSIEEMTGIPMRRLYRKLSNAFSAKKDEHAALTKEIVLFTKASAEDQTAVREHYALMYAGKDPDMSGRTQTQKDYIAAIDRLMEKMRGDVFDYRFKIWEDNVLRPKMERESLRRNLIGNQYTKLENVRDPRVFKMQDNEVISKLLHDLHNSKMKEELGIELQPGEIPYQMLRDTAIDQYGLGLVREGAYLPEIFTHANPNKLSAAEQIMHIDALNKTPFQSRTIKLANGKEVDLDAMILGEHYKEQNLSKQLEAYVGQVLNIKHFDEPLRALDSIGEIFYRDFKEAKPNAFMRGTPEAKSYSMADSLTLWSTRLKGFPVKIGGLGRALKATQTVFFRSLTVRPMLIARNFPQRIVTAPNRIRLLLQTGKGAKFNKLPEDAQRFFDVQGTREMDMINNQFLEIESNYKWDKVPVLGHIWRFAGEVGKLYALSDVYNRRFVFSKMWFNNSEAIKKFRAGEIDQNTMEHRAGIQKMMPLEQREFREEIELGNDSRAASVGARWQTVNSQWYYGRHERSLQEMTAEGETYTNLLTWSKSMAQQTYHTYERITDGYKRYKILKSQGKGDMFNGPAGQAMRQSFDGVAQVIGLGIAGGVANALLNTASMNHKGRYQAYGFDMFTWEMGGVTQEILTSFTTGLADLVSAADGTPEDKKRAMDAMWKMADNVGIRQLFPFAKSALSIMESFTGKSYMTPIYSFFSKYEYGYPKGVKLVDRTLLERFTHALLATDPNKSEDVKRWAFDHLRETEVKYASATNPAEKAYLWAQVEKYKYFNDLFQRYTPYEAQKIVDQQQREKWIKGSLMDLNQYDYNLQKQMRKFR